MKTRILLPFMIIALALSFTACKEAEATSASEEPVDTTLTIQETRWAETGSGEEDPVVYNPLEAGDTVYDYMDCEIEIGSVTEDRIVLDIDGCLVEPNDNGSINLNADPLEEVELEAGESITLVSQTMDAGIRLVITYEG